MGIDYYSGRLPYLADVPFGHTLHGCFDEGASESGWAALAGTGWSVDADTDATMDDVILFPKFTNGEMAVYGYVGNLIVNAEFGLVSEARSHLEQFMKDLAVDGEIFENYKVTQVG